MKNPTPSSGSIIINPKRAFTPLRLQTAPSLLFVIVAAVGAVAAPNSHSSTANFTKQTGALTFAERVAYQRAIEDVYWRHRIWPNENPDPKPPLDAVMFQAQLEKKVEDYLRNSQALEDYWQRPVTAEQLQAEMERMAQHTKQPEMLRGLFEALGNDPFVIAECLVRPVLSERLLTNSSAYDERFNGKVRSLTPPASGSYSLPIISDGPNGCIDDTWTATTTTNAPSARAVHTAVWTGSEMIVWGGEDDMGITNTGGRYSPATDSWTATSTTNAPTGRNYHRAVWTGSEMIVWGGLDAHGYPNTGGRYDPSTNSWTATSITNAPTGRAQHTAVWTGNEMIVWGGETNVDFNTGGRYNPSSDTWTATSTTNAPTGRSDHTVVWTGSEMIIWGGGNHNGTFNTGGRYNPSSDTWTATSITNAPASRGRHTAVWTSSKMIVWGGSTFDSSGGRYNPNTDTWATTSITNAPIGRDDHTAVWTGSEMIIWGGNNGSYLDTGGRYNLGTDSWTATSTANVPVARSGHTAVWTSSEMIVWGGGATIGPPPPTYFNTGGRYCVQSGSPTPTPTPTATATPLPRHSPTPRPRPTPDRRPTS